MFDTEFFHSLTGVPSGGKSPSKNIKELWIKATNAHISDVKIGSEDTGDWVLLWLEDEPVEAFDFDLGLFGESAGHGGLGLSWVAGLDSETVDGFAWEKVVLAVDWVGEVLGLVGVEEEFELFFDRRGDKVIFADLYFFAYILFGLDKIDL